VANDESLAFLTDIVPLNKDSSLPFGGRIYVRKTDGR
jgi:hypothetical protein